MTALLPEDALAATSEIVVTAWTPVCDRSALHVDRGVAVMVGPTPVAIFVLAPLAADGREQLVAIDHIDPKTGTPTMARGLVGSVGDIPVVAAPLHKERYDLLTGRCLDDPELCVSVYETRLHGTTIELRMNVTSEKRAGNTATPDS